MVKKFRKVGSAGALALDTNAIIEVTVSGGLPVESDPEGSSRVTKHVTAEGKRVRVTGGLPDVLMGELMTPEQRKEHDDRMHAGVHGLAGKPVLGTGD